MIKNVVFDVGGVLLEWNPPKFLKEMGLPLEFLEVFESLLWGAHDGGILSRQEVIEKLPAHLDRKAFSHCVANLSKQMKPIPQMIEWFYSLKKERYPVFILSNMPKEMHEELSFLHDFFAHSEGAVFSYQIKAIKPQPQIYETLLQTYNLSPEETVFIDDRKENIFAAKKLQIVGIHCTDSNQVQEEVSHLLAKKS